MHEEIIFAGFGGQGIMLMGKIVAHSAMLEGREVTWMPSYGAEQRGGTAYSMVVVSDSKITSPVVPSPTSCIIMNAPSLDKFENRVRKNGLVFVNCSMCARKLTRQDVEAVYIPATQMASDIGNVRAANMLMLGAYITKSGLVRVESVLAALKDVVPSKGDLYSINERALRQGEHLIKY
jgi:2-oxoglutarate ferredoxin oxidoreductase subunit gamma